MPLSCSNGTVDSLIIKNGAKGTNGENRAEESVINLSPSLSPTINDS